MNLTNCFFITLFLSSVALGKGDDWGRQSKPKKGFKEKQPIQKMESSSPSHGEKKRKKNISTKIKVFNVKNFKKCTANLRQDFFRQAGQFLLA
jgi:hypothetical protein